MATRLQGIAEAVHETLDDPTVKLLVGRKHVKEHAQQRRILWVTAPSKTSPPKMAGEHFDQENEEEPSGVCIMNREQAVVVWVCAENEETTEKLFENFLVALEATLQTSYTFPTYRFVFEAEGENPRLARQELVELTFSVRLPVSDAPHRLATIEATEGTQELLP